MLSQLLEAHKYNLCIELSYYAEKRDVPIVIKITSITLGFVQGDDVGISHVLLYCSFSPVLEEDIM